MSVGMHVSQKLWPLCFLFMIAATPCCPQIQPLLSACLIIENELEIEGFTSVVMFYCLSYIRYTDIHCTVLYAFLYTENISIIAKKIK